MANMRRMPYTTPIPAGAKIITRKGERLARWKGKGGKTVEAPLNEDGTRVRLLTSKWYGEYIDAEGVEQCVPLSTDKAAAQQMLADLVKKVELAKAGLADPYEEHRKRPLADHLDDWAAFLSAGGAGAKHVHDTLTCARRIVEGCGFTFIADLSASAVQQFLAGLRESRHELPLFDPSQEWYKKAEVAAALGVKVCNVPSLVRRHRLAAAGNGKTRRYPRETVEALRALRSRGRSIKTSNLYLDAIKGFAAWLVRDRRTADNPLSHLEGGNVKLDRRHDRRALALDELRAVLDAAARSDVTFRGLAGTDRCFLYLTACVTGFRAEELACLRPESFAFDGEPPVAILGAAETKNRKGAVQPLPPDVVEVLRGYAADRPVGVPLWPGNWWQRGADMLRIDLDAAGIPYAVEGPDGPLYADFHALRHSFIALLEQSGASLKIAMYLARHSDPKLTMAVYARPQLFEGERAVERFPSLTPGAAGKATGATGTEGKSGVAGRKVSTGIESLAQENAQSPTG